MYYLQSRYYDPDIGRFINADDPMTMLLTNNILGANLFAYCYNNPVMFTDPTGYIAIRTDLLIQAIDIGLWLIPVLSGLNKVLKAFKGVGLGGRKIQNLVKTIVQGLTKAMSALKKLVVKALQKLGVKNTSKLIAKIAGIGKLTWALNQFIMNVTSISVGTVIVWIACLFFKTEIRAVRQYVFWGSKIPVKYIII